jgi:anti-anti-sigma regulatory factor
MAKLGLAPIVTGDQAQIVAIGELTPGTVSAIAQAVNELLDEGVTALTLDLRQVTTVAGESLDALVTAASFACERGVPVRLSAGSATRERLEAAKTTALFAAIDEAVATAGSMRALLHVGADETALPELEAVTWVSTEEPSVRGAEATEV